MLVELFEDLKDEMAEQPHYSRVRFKSTNLAHHPNGHKPRLEISYTNSGLPCSIAAEYSNSGSITVYFDRKRHLETSHINTAFTCIKRKIDNTGR